ncbi:MAG: hypothetical protein LBR22_07705 [Desulfovibrio sp.]|jgi:uncharacterized phage-associated protein|nr:hypothetical protein [Desulfovibrio sp.]
MPTVQDVADFFLANADEDDPITHMKLQKLCAYAWAFPLALQNKWIFNGNLVAWTHSPANCELYDTYKSLRHMPLSTIVD